MNAVNRMISRLKGVHFIAVNTDAQAQFILAEHKMQIDQTDKDWAGADPEIGKKRRKRAADELMHLQRC